MGAHGFSGTQKKWYRKAFVLALFTVGYNLVEGGVSLLAGSRANSMALVSFGLDSFAESLSGLIVLWRFYHAHKDSGEENEKKEKMASVLVGYTFYVFGAYVFYDVIKKLIEREIPEPSVLGIVILILSIIIMPILFYQKYRTGKVLKSQSLVGDSKETLACVFLSVATLLGQLANYFWGLWQLDPFLAFLVCVFLFREGYHTLKKKEVCAC